VELPVLGPCQEGHGAAAEFDWQGKGSGRRAQTEGLHARRRARPERPTKSPANAKTSIGREKFTGSIAKVATAFS
jgi:hypothetical protein